MNQNKLWSRYKTSVYKPNSRKNKVQNIVCAFCIKIKGVEENTSERIVKEEDGKRVRSKG